MQKFLHDTIKLLATVVVGTSCSAEPLTDGVYLGERCVFTLNLLDAVHFQERCNGDFRRMEKNGARLAFSSQEDGAYARETISKDAQSEGRLNYLSFVVDFSHECRLNNKCSQGLQETKYLRDFLQLDVGGNNWIFWPTSKLHQRMLSGSPNDPGLNTFHGVEAAGSLFVVTSYQQLLPEYAIFSAIKFEKE